MATFARPVASQIAGINFDTYSDKDIKATSVKRIHNTPTLDSFNNPVPGGLYDPALGAWGDHVYAFPSYEFSSLLRRNSPDEKANTI